MTHSVLVPVRTTFRAIARTVVPETASLSPSAWVELESIVGSALDARPPAMRRQLIGFVRLLDLASRLRYGRPLASLDAERRERLLQRVERSPLLLLRRGMWGVRTLVLMGYYARPQAAAEIGYASSALGWAARGGTITMVPLAPARVWVEPGPGAPARGPRGGRGDATPMPADE